MELVSWLVSLNVLQTSSHTTFVSHSYHVHVIHYGIYHTIFRKLLKDTLTCRSTVRQKVKLNALLCVDVACLHRLT
jgi:hypothetical protein